jgi:hypothetical protein
MGPVAAKIFAAGDTELAVAATISRSDDDEIACLESSPQTASGFLNGA